MDESKADDVTVTATLKDHDDVFASFSFVGGKAIETTTYRLSLCDDTTGTEVDLLYDAFSSDDISTIQTANLAP